MAILRIAELLTLDTVQTLRGTSGVRGLMEKCRVVFHAILIDLLRRIADVELSLHRNHYPVF